MHIKPLSAFPSYLQYNCDQTKCKMFVRYLCLTTVILLEAFLYFLFTYFKNFLAGRQTAFRSEGILWPIGGLSHYDSRLLIAACRTIDHSRLAKTRCKAEIRLPTGVCQLQIAIGFGAQRRKTLGKMAFWADTEQIRSDHKQQPLGWQRGLCRWQKWRCKRSLLSLIIKDNKSRPSTLLGLNSNAHRSAAMTDEAYRHLYRTRHATKCFVEGF